MRFMAAESNTSPLLEAMTSMPMAVQSLSEFMLLLDGGQRRVCVFVFAPLGKRWSAGHQAHAAGDQQHAGPSPRADSFMQEKAREKSGDHVTKRRRGQNVSEVGPGKRGEIGIKETRQARNADDDPGIEKSVEDVGPVVEMDFAEVFHAAFEQHVACAVAAGDCQIDENFLELHSEVRLLPARTRD